MKNMTIQNMAAACNGKIYAADADNPAKWKELDFMQTEGKGNDNASHLVPEYLQIADEEVQGIVIDSRLVEEGYAFVATRGEKVDGHSFIPQVFEKGAKAVVCEKLPETPVGICIVVEDSFQALKDLAEFYRQQLTIPIVGVTGSVGKTTTRSMIATVLSEHFCTHSTKGNFNNEIGVPLTLFGIREEHEVAVVEMGINHFGEMTRLSKMVRPNICVITNIGTCHLENLGDRDGVLRAKTEIFQYMQPDGVAVLNGDDDKLQTVKEVHGKAPIFFGYADMLENSQFAANLKDGNSDNPDSDNIQSGNARGENNRSHFYYAGNIQNHGLLGSKFTISNNDGLSLPVDLHIPGIHMVGNSLAATAVGQSLGMKAEEIAAGLSKCKSVGGRSNILELEHLTVIDDCYNANPTSTKAALDLLKTSGTKNVAILGDMFELGTGEKELHYGIGEYAMSIGIDQLICIGNLSQNMRDGALKYRTDAAEAEGTSIVWFQTVEEAAGKLPELIAKDSSVLVKASHGMHFENLLPVLEKI